MSTKTLPCANTHHGHSQHVAGQWDFCGHSQSPPPEPCKPTQTTPHSYAGRHRCCCRRCLVRASERRSRQGRVFLVKNIVDTYIYHCLTTIGRDISKGRPAKCYIPTFFSLVQPMKKSFYSYPSHMHQTAAFGGSFLLFSCNVIQDES